MQHRFAFSLHLRQILLISIALLAGLLLWQSRRSAVAAPLITLDGVRDSGYGTAIATDPANDLASPGPKDWVGVAWTDLTAIYCQRDATYLYVYVDLPAYAQNVSSGRFGLAINTTGGGGTSDPWGQAITFNHSDKPDRAVRGNIPGIAGSDENNGWTELRSWSGSAWSAGGTNWGGISGSSQVGSNIAYANNQGVELRLAFSDLGVPNTASVGLEFFANQPGGSKGAYDTVPSDDQASGWDDATTLTQYATCSPAASPTNTPTATATATQTPSATPTNTPTHTPTSTATPTNTPSPTHTATPTQTPTATNTPEPTPITPVPPAGVLLYSDLYTVAPGATTTVYINIENATTSNVAAANIEVDYDPAVLQLAACEVNPDDAAFDGGLCNPTYAAGTVKFNILSLAGIQADVRLLALTFEAIGAAGSGSPLDLRVNVLTDANGAALVHQVIDGRVDIVGPNDVVIKIDSYATTPGGNREVLVSAVNLPAGMQTIRLTLLYDPAVIRPTGCADVPDDGYTLANCNLTFENNLYNPDAIRMLLNADSAGRTVAAQGLVNLTFTTVGSPYQHSPLTLQINTLTDGNGQPLSALAQSGRVVVNSSIPTAVRLSADAAPVTGSPSRLALAAGVLLMLPLVWFVRRRVG